MSLEHPQNIESWGEEKNENTVELAVERYKPSCCCTDLKLAVVGGTNMTHDVFIPTIEIYGLQNQQRI